MTVFMYYETDGDSGYHSIKLFSMLDYAMQYKKEKSNGYGNVEAYEVIDMAAIEETLCPDCNGPMVSRKSVHGVFWGCKAYPKCKGTRDSMGRSKAEREAEQTEEREKKNAEPNRYPFRKC